MISIRQLEKNDLIHKNHDYDLIKKYSFVAIDNDNIIGHIIVQRPLIIECIVDHNHSYEDIGKLLLISALSKMQNCSIDVVINIDDNAKKHLYMKTFNFKVICILNNFIKLRLDDILII